MNTQPSPEVGIWLRRVLDQFGVSRYALANAAGIAPGTLRNAETGRHRISRQAASRLLAEIARRDVLLANTAPSSLKAAAAPPARWPDTARDPVTPTSPALVQLRVEPSGQRRALLQVELDTQAVRKLVRALDDLLSRGELPSQADLPRLHLVLDEKK